MLTTTVLNSGRSGYFRFRDARYLETAGSARSRRRRRPPAKLPKPLPQAEPPSQVSVGLSPFGRVASNRFATEVRASAFRLPAASAGGAFGAHPARFRVSRHGRSDHSAPQRTDRANFSEGTAGGMPVTPERGLGGRDLTTFPSVGPDSALLVRKGRVRVS